VVPLAGRVVLSGAEVEVRSPKDAELVSPACVSDGLSDFGAIVAEPQRDGNATHLVSSDDDACHR